MKQMGRACYEQAIEGLCGELWEELIGLAPEQRKQVREIRLIAGSLPVLDIAGVKTRMGQPVTQKQLEKSLISLCGGAVHSHQRELAQGFVSLPGGHRAGIAATAVYAENGMLQGVRAIDAIVIRVAHDPPAPPQGLLQSLFSSGLCGLLLAGVPGSGKTTMLRALAEMMAGGQMPGVRSVAVVDERGELGRGANGCCLLTGYNKSDGIMLAVRSLAPQVIFCDEIGSRRDVEALCWAVNCGVAVIASIHAETPHELCRRQAGRLLLCSGAFERIAFLDAYPHPGTVREVMDLAALDPYLRSSDDPALLHFGWDADGASLSAPCL